MDHLVDWHWEWQLKEKQASRAPADSQLFVGWTERGLRWYGCVGICPMHRTPRAHTTPLGVPSRSCTPPPLPPPSSLLLLPPPALSIRMPTETNSTTNTNQHMLMLCLSLLPQILHPEFSLQEVYQQFCRRPVQIYPL